MQLNKDQLKACDDITKFFADPSATEMLLIGAGGVGKGVVLHHLSTNWATVITEAKEINPATKVVYPLFAATTNEAVGVLSSKGMRASTVFKYASLRPTYSGKLVASNPPNFSNGIIFIDEASMVSKDTYAMIKQQLPNFKIVWVLDNAQLAPVGETLPYVNCINLPETHLTKIMRSIGPLQELNTVLRNCVMNQEYTKLKEFANGKDIILTDTTEFETMISDSFGDDEWEPRKSRVLVFRNVQRDMFNEGIHMKVKGYSDLYATGTFLRQNGYSHQLNDGHCIQVDHVHYEDSTYLQDTEFKLRTIITTKGTKYVELLDHAKYTTAFFKGLKGGLRGLTPPEQFCNFSHIYSSTVHKAQGSTIETVFVDLMDIVRSNNSCAEMYRRLLYTAVSRASQRVVVRISNE